MVPDDCMILTLACGKYRFNKLDFGTVAGLQGFLISDSVMMYILLFLLPMPFQMHLVQMSTDFLYLLLFHGMSRRLLQTLLALLSLGIKNIYLGPTLPAFLSPNVLQYLVDTFQLRLISNPEDDIKTCLGQAV